MHHPCTCALMNGVHATASMLCPTVFPTKNCRSEVTVMLKTKLKKPILREFSGYWHSFFKCNTYRVTALRLFEEERKKERKKEERKKERRKERKKERKKEKR